MRTCECGCGTETEGGTFVPGHDQTLRVKLEARVGGLLALRQLVDAMEKYAEGEMGSDDLGKFVRRIFATKRRAV